MCLLGPVPRNMVAAAAAKSLQSCPTLCDPRDSNPPGFPIPGILQARTLEWVAISFSNAWEWKVKVKSLSCVWLLVTPRTACYQAPPFMGFSRQEYWSGLPLPSLKEHGWVLGKLGPGTQIPLECPGCSAYFLCVAVSSVSLSLSLSLCLSSLSLSLPLFGCIYSCLLPTYLQSWTTPNLLILQN